MESINHANILNIVNDVLNQQAFIRKNVQFIYYCPFCHHKKRKLEINVESQKWHCWVCDSKGNSILNLFKKLKVKSFYIKQLHEILGTEIYGNKKSSFDNKEKCSSLPSEFSPIYKPVRSIEYNAAVRYIKSRNVTTEDVIRYNIGYCETGEYARRIIVPSYDIKSNINFFVARSYYENTMSYVACPFSKDIVGFEMFINYDEPLTLVEGVFDAFAVKNNAIPLFGKTMSNRLQESIIENNVKRINVVLDNDALKSSIKIYDQLSKLGVNVHLIKLDSKDPSVIGFKNITEMIESSRPLDFSDLLRYKLYDL